MTKPKINFQSLPPTMYVFVRQWVKWMDIPQFFETHLQRIVHVMTQAGVPPQYPPSIFIHKVDNEAEQSELSVAIQTHSPVAITGGGTIEFPAGAALMVEHIGALENTEIAHDCLSEYVEINNLTVGVAIEEYRSNLTDEPDESKWITHIIYRLYDGKEVPRLIC